MGFSFDTKWEKQLDNYLTNPPEGAESKCRCYECGEELQEGEDFYRLDDEVYCSGCAEEWFDLHKSTVTEDMAYGE